MVAVATRLQLDIASAVFAIFALLLIVFISRSFRAGRIVGVDPSRGLDRKTNPKRFWGWMAYFSVFALILLAAFAWTLIRARYAQ